MFIVYCLLFAKNCTNQIKSNYLSSHDEEAQEKPPGLPFDAFALSGDGSTRGGKFKADILTGKEVGQAWSEAAAVVKNGFQSSIPMSMRIIEDIVRNFIFRRLTERTMIADYF